MRKDVISSGKGEKPMADASFDVVMVGGGTKVLPTACYLTKFGKMSVGIFEGRAELGEGVYSVQSPAPGFVANTHSHWHSERAYYGTMQEDIPELVDYGLKYKPMLLNFGQYFVEDDSWIGTYHPGIDPTGERTAKLWERFSKRDAESWLYYHDKMVKYWIPAILEYINTPVPPPDQPNAFSRLFADPEKTGLKPRWVSMRPVDVYSDMFESPEAQTAWTRFVWSAAGGAPDGHGQGILALIMLAICMMGSDVIPGGSHAVVHAQQKVIMENGGKVFTNNEVVKVLVENGRARGIRLADGTEVEAKRAIVFGLTPFALIKLIGEEFFRDEIRRRINKLERDYMCISWYTWALHEHPRYKGADFHPDIDGMDWMCVGSKDPEDLVVASRRQRLHMWPDVEKPGAGVISLSNHSWASPELAPPGKSCVLHECYVPPAHSKSPEEWMKFERQHAEDVLRRWNVIAPNMNWDNVIGYNAITPFNLTEENPVAYGKEGNWFQIDAAPAQFDGCAPIPEWSQTKIPEIEGMYTAGRSWGIGGGSSWEGYRCYRVMAGDFGLPVPGMERGRPY